MSRYFLMAFVLASPFWDDSPDETFAKLWGSAKSDPSKADFGAIRAAYTKTTKYQPYGILSKEKAAVDKAMKAQDFTAAIAAVDIVLEKKPLDIDSHLLAAFLHSKAGDQKIEQMHRAIVHGLLSAIIEGHDGTSFDQAIPVIAVDEEYAVLKTLRLESTGHGLQIHEGKRYDVHKIKPSADQEERELFFDVTTPMNELSKLLEPKK